MRGFKQYEAHNPCLRDYAAFRASEVPAGERQKAERFHLYAQYACHRQLLDIGETAARGECAELYIDYPVGLHTRGFDAQHFSHLFMSGFQVGAPPDLFFSKGQSWGFRPVHPRAFERDRFAYFRATIAHYFRYARMLRLDHIMGLYRIYCIPDNMGAHEGAYIYYPFEAFLAVLCLEAHRHEGVLIGEDLGTVPDAVRKGMRAHNLNRMWLLQFEINEDPAETFETIEPAMIAGFNTHDLFPFEAFLDGRDMEKLQALGLLDEKGADEILKKRHKQLRKWKKKDDPFLYGLQKMGESAARYVMANIEDLWRETEPQNIPGTTDQYPNWRKRLSVPLERWYERADVMDALKILNEARSKEKTS